MKKLGMKPQESGDQPGALNAYSKSVVLNVSREEAWLNLAYLQRSSSPPSAVAACMGALKANPKSHRAYTLLGDAMGFAGRADAALQAYAAAIKAEPKWAQAHCGLVRALIAGGTLDSAREAAERGAKACPDDASVHCTVGLAMLVSLIDPNSAESLMRRYLMLLFSLGLQTPSFKNRTEH